MCELFGISSKNRISINEYLKEFYGHCDEHPHGWGLAIMDDNEYIIEKQSIKASESEKLKQILSSPVIVKHAFAHIRLATIGHMDSCNCHPFSETDNSGRTWTLIHNGTIFKFDALYKYKSKQRGQTDSERILLYIVDQVNDCHDELGRALNSKERFQLLENSVSRLANGNKLDIMIYDGELMYIHANYKQSLYYLKMDDAIIVSTKALSNENWSEFPINRLVAIRNGEIIFQSEAHEHEYVITGEHLNYILDHVGPELRESFLNNLGNLNYAREYRLKR